MKNLWNRLAGLFRRDTCGEGESNRPIIAMRVVEFLCFVYALVNCVQTSIVNCYNISIFYIAAAFGYLVLLHLTYRLKMVAQTVLFHVFTFALITVGVVTFGSNMLIQNFFFVLVIMAFFSGYGKYKLKASYATFMGIWFLLLQIHSNRRGAMVPLPDGSYIFSMVTNIVVSFLSIAYICYAYSRDSQHLEGKLMEYNVLLKKQASTDALTGLQNRRGALEYIDRLISRNDPRGFCVCMCDIDFFKRVNDSYGHDIGDKVLSGIARTMLDGFPKECMISRWGGEEFLVIFPDMNGDTAKMLLDGMRNKVKKLEFTAGEKKFGITVTYGLAEYGFGGNADSTVKEADDKLYLGKENGRDQVVY